MLKIGEKIKDLRKKQDVTQEKLAAYLNISYQAISKWENGTALPDLTLLPGIANFFGVSTDELLGMNDDHNVEELKAYEENYHVNRRKGKMHDNVALSREVLSKYPSNFQWMINLAYSLIQYNDTEEHITYSKEYDFLGEAIQLCERVLQDCMVDSIRHSAIQILCYEYPRVGKKDLAVKLVQQMPEGILSKDELLVHIYDGEEQVKQLQNNLLHMVERCAGTIWMLVSNDIIGKELSADQKIELLDTANNLFFTILKDDEDLFYYNVTLCRNYMKMAKFWCDLDKGREALDCLFLAAESAKKFDRWAESSALTYQSVLVNRCSIDPKHLGKNGEYTEAELMLLNLENIIFDKIRETDEFKQLVNGLR